MLFRSPEIDISDDYEYAFRWACYNCHIKVAQWLLTIKPTINISVDNYSCFRYACEHSYLEVAEWLKSLCPDKYELVVENNKIISYCVKRELPYNADTVTIQLKEVSVCPICYDAEKKVEVQTNCGHNFCSKCITDYYNKCYENCQCPYCRQIITSFNKLEIQLCELSN